MRRIRVAHVITRLCTGGAQENTFHTVRLANRDRFEVDLISGPTRGGEGSIEEAVRAAGIEIQREPLLVRSPAPLRDMITLWRLTRRFRDRQYDIVHTHTSKAGFLGRLAAERAGTPIVVHTPHGNIFHGYFSGWLTRIFVWMERHAARRTDRIIELTAGGVEEHLAERGVEHRAAEDHRLVFIHHEAHGHNPQAVGDERLDAVFDHLRGLAHADHAGNVGAVDIRVEQRHLRPERLKRIRQIHRRRGFPHAALARGARHDILHARNRRAVFGRVALAHLGGHHHFHFAYTGNLAQRVFHVRLDFMLQRTRRSGQFHRHAHLAIARQPDVFDHAQRHEVFAQIGIENGTERFENRLLSQRHARSLLKKRKDTLSGGNRAKRIDPAPPFHPLPDSLANLPRRANLKDSRFTATPPRERGVVDTRRRAGEDEAD